MFLKMIIIITPITLTIFYIRHVWLLVHYTMSYIRQILIVKDMLPVQHGSYGEL